MGKLGLQRDKDHRERVAQKHDALELAKAMRDTYAQRLPAHDPMVKHWETRVKKLETQLKNMRP